MSNYRTYYPVFLDVKDRPCLVVGGGAIGLEKSRGLAEAGARVRVIAPEVLPEIQEMALKGQVEWVRRTFRSTDLDGQFLVFGATDDNEVNRLVAAQADAHGKLANAVDDPGFCNFILAAIASQGPMTVAVSSAGCSPALAQRVRNRIAEEILEPGIGPLAELLGHWRPQTKECIEGYRERKAFWESVLEGPAPIHVREGNMDAAETAVAEELTRHCTSQCGAKGLGCRAQHAFDCGDLAPLCGAVQEGKA